MISREDLNRGMCGTGGMGYDDEWHWSGEYYMYLYNSSMDLKHKYYIQFHRRGNVGNTLGWMASINLSLSAPNSGEISVGKRIKERSIKKCKDKIFSWIEHTEEGNGDFLINKWKDNHRMPVFILEEGKPIIISHTYKHVANDLKDNNQFDYWKDHSYEYKSGVNYYTLHLNWKGDKISISYGERSWATICSGSAKIENKEEVINDVYDQIKCNPKYAFFVSNIKDIIECQLVITQ